jgi:hypothetical protein
VAAKNEISVTATKIVDGKKQAVIYSGSGKSVTLTREHLVRYEAHGSEDTIFILADGTQIIGQQEYADVNTAISATDSTGS